MGLEIISIIIGILGAITGVFFKEAFRKTSEQKKIAIKLEVYLQKYELDIFDDETLSGLHEIFTEDYWNELIAPDLPHFNQDVYQYLENVKIKKDYLEKTLRLPDGSVHNELYDKLHQSYNSLKSLTNKEFANLQKTYERNFDNIESSHYLITDDEASLLSSRILHMVLIFSSHLYTMREKLISHTILMRESKEFNFEKSLESLLEVFHHFAYLSELIYPLRYDAEKFSQKNKLILLIKNIFS